MELRDNWEQVKSVFAAGLKSTGYCAIATVGADGWPHVTPIGFIFLRDDQSAYYFEEYTQKMRHNIEHDPRVSLMTVNIGAMFWLRSLYNGTFASAPGIRLTGLAGARRLASEPERAAYRARVSRFRKLKGYGLIWSDLRYVREIKLQGFSPVGYPRMTDHLWK